MAERNFNERNVVPTGKEPDEKCKKQKRKLTKPVRESIAKCKNLCTDIDAFVNERHKLIPGATVQHPKHDVDILERLAATLQNIHKELAFCEQRLNIIENGELDVIKGHAYENDGRGGSLGSTPTLHVHACNDLAELEKETGIDTLRKTRASVAFYQAEI